MVYYGEPWLGEALDDCLHWQKLSLRALWEPVLPGNECHPVTPPRLRCVMPWMNRWSLILQPYGTSQTPKAQADNLDGDSIDSRCVLQTLMHWIIVPLRKLVLRHPFCSKFAVRSLHGVQHGHSANEPLEQWSSLECHVCVETWRTLQS